MYKDLDKDKIYCFHCYKEGIIKVLSFEESFCKEHINQPGGNYYRLEWCNECECFVTKRGLNKTSICRKCSTRQQKENGVGFFSKESHEKSAKTQLKNKIGIHSTEAHKKAYETQMNNLTDEEKKQRLLLITETQRINKSGIFSESAREVTKQRNAQSLIDSTGIYSKESRRKSTEIRMKNKSGIFSSESYKKSFETRKELDLLSEIFKPNFTKKDGILYYKKIPWENYKKEFLSKYIDYDDFNKYNGFWQKTYRVNDSDSTGQDAMEQELVENGIHWLVYIKFYIDKDNEIKPLVVGKSGSLLVNVQGTDINFSYDDRNGNAAGRKLLNDESLKWFKDKIYIIPCNSEKEALKLEKQIQEEFSLYGG